MKTSEEKKKYKREWYLANKDKVKEYNLRNKEKIYKKQKEWEKNNPNNNKERAKIWREKNPEKAKENRAKSIKKRKENDNLFRLKCNIKSMLAKTLSRKGYKKKSRSHEIIGCSFEEFKLYLESKFEPWMTWDNYGLYNGTPNYGWDIDHIIPQSSANTEEELLRLNHFSNLQPLCSKVNRDIKKNLSTITLELSMDF